MSVPEKRLSKFLALLLRHRAEKFGLAVEAGTGYADLDEVESICTRMFKGRVSRGDILALVAHSPDGKQRFEVVDRRIRALYGHSQVVVDYPTVDPPEFLYHGTAPGRAELILQSGLQGMGRTYVHLAHNVPYALQVGGRHSRTPVVLRVRAADAAANGVSFFCPDKTHYLARSVPPEWLEPLPS